MYRKENVPLDPAQMPQFVDQELSRLEAALQAPVPFVSLTVAYAEPAKVWDGMVLIADGTNWNPGSGTGFYGYRAGAWRFLG